MNCRQCVCSAVSSVFLAIVASSCAPEDPNAAPDDEFEQVASELVLPTKTFEIWAGVGPNASHLQATHFRGMKDSNHTGTTRGWNVFNVADTKLGMSLSADQSMKQTGQHSLFAGAVNGSDIEGRTTTITNDFKSQRGMGQYWISDEPSALQFANIQAIAAKLKVKDSTHGRYVNLLPIYASPAQLGAPDYRTYVKDFVLKAKDVDLYGFDYYPWLTSGSRTDDWYLNLSYFYPPDNGNKNFLVWLQAGAGGGLRNPTVSEARWQTFSALAFGAKGIAWWNYWDAQYEAYFYGVVAADGTKTALWPYLRDFNARIKNIGKYLAPAKATDVWFNSTPYPKGMHGRASGDAIKIVTAHPFYVGEFSVSNDAISRLILVGSACLGTCDTDIWLSSADGAPQVLDSVTGTWSKIPVLETKGSLTRHRLSLTEADAKLIYVKKPPFQL